MRGFLGSLICTTALVGIAMQFERPAASAVAPASVAPATTPAPTYTEPAKPAPAATTAPAAAPTTYRWEKRCDGKSCKWVRVAVANAVGKATGTTRSNCDCGCGCGNCNCGMQPVQSEVQSGDPVRRGLFGRRSGGRLFGGRLFGGGCRGCGR